MKIKDAAELTGTTVRTIRWYHQEGLVPVPENRGGRRDYQLHHVARILRVRWLAQAGLPLSNVRDLLDREDNAGREESSVGGDSTDHAGNKTSADTADRMDATDHADHQLRTVPPTVHSAQPVPSGAAVDDLYAALYQVDTSLEELHAQRQRILHLIDAAESGRGLSSIPPQIDRVYSRLEQAVPQDPHIQRVLRRERNMAEMLCQRGLIRADVIDALDLPDNQIDRMVDFLERFVAIKDVPGQELEGAVVELSGDMLQWCLEHPELVRLYLAVMPGWNVPAVRSVVMGLLMLEYRDPNQRALLRHALDGLTELISQGAFDPESAPATTQLSATRASGDPS
ncbi:MULTISPECIES: MerR family transcriptional regulator [Kocuria]|uniref:MerR family transcriptional regulator n=1 Tax=Kocuria subflava TaxID=1736139 RepID=A0A846TRD5_9MICC|nr:MULTISPECIES: MerR family transcriptional regulator [Kocuria]NKE08404.1 MerR family transcriptional regulator [Kocuria subflava]